MAKKRINGEGTVLYVASEKRYRAQYPAGGKRRTISGKTRREVELKLRDALAKRDTNTLEKSRKESDTVEDFLLFWVSAPLYNETEVIRGGFLDEVIVLCESESSVDAMTGRGIYSTTWAGGANAVKTRRLVEVLKDRRVLWIPDNDRAGLKCSLVIEEALSSEVRRWHVLMGSEDEDARDLLNRDILNLHYLSSL